jgi:hypothetical protein
MSDIGYMIWLVATAVMVMTVLTVGTLKAAELFPERRRKDARNPHPQPVAVRTDEQRR